MFQSSRNKETIVFAIPKPVYDQNKVVYVFYRQHF